MKVYIAGPMTGLPHFNRPAFQQAAINLSFEKHVPLNPAILPDGLTEADYMAIGLTMLQRAEAIYLLTDRLAVQRGRQSRTCAGLKAGF